MPGPTATAGVVGVLRLSATDRTLRQRRAVPGWICSCVQNPPEVPPCARGDAILIFEGAAVPYFDI